MMRWYRYSIGIALGILSCNGYKNYTSKKIHPYVYSDSLCQFDNFVDIAKERISEKKHSLIVASGDTIVTNNDTLNEAFWRLNNNKVTNKQTNKQTNITRWIDYYNTGSVKKVSFDYEKGFLKIGKSTEYDSLGRVTAVIDHRDTLHYAICFQEAIAIVEGVLKPQDSITLLTRQIYSNEENTDTYRWFQKKGYIPKDQKACYVWEVFFHESLPSEGKGAYNAFCYRINAQTGQLFQKLKVTVGP